MTMTQVVDESNCFLAEYHRLERSEACGQEWLAGLRRAGAERFSAAGFPTVKQEEWRDTNVTAIAQGQFAPGGMDDSSATKAGVAKFSFGDDASAELVFINGRFAPQYSSVAALPKGVRVASLGQMLDADGAFLAQRLGKCASVDGHGFVALNTALMRDGAVVHLSRKAVLGKPIHLLFLAVAGGEEAIAAHPRTLIVLDEHADGAVVETYAGIGEGTSLTNAVTEVVLGACSRLDHCKLQQETRSSYHVAAMHVEVGATANFVSHSATLGGRLARNDLEVVLNGSGAEATLNGLVIANEQQHMDNHTLLRHEKPNCVSHELYKHVLDGKSSVVFKGKIFVQKDAQKTDSKQTSKSLLLSNDALMNSQPALEIYADDVKCTHGSTTGPVDEDMVYYLRSRGVSLEASRHLLTYAFAADVTRRIRVAPVRVRLEDFMAAQHGLPQDLRITEAGTAEEKAR